MMIRPPRSPLFPYTAIFGSHREGPRLYSFLFFLNDTPPPEISPLPLHDALPISTPRTAAGGLRWGPRAAPPAWPSGRGATRRAKPESARPPGRAGNASSGASATAPAACPRSEEHTSELQSRLHLVCRLLLEKKKK